MNQRFSYISAAKIRTAARQQYFGSELKELELAPGSGV
jgi:hypothetical protein